MATPTEPTHGENLAPDFEQVNDADLGPLTWIESAVGFPDGGLGHVVAESEGGYEVHRDGQCAGQSSQSHDVLVSTEDCTFIRGQADLIIAFTEFLAGTKLDPDEREWLTDTMADEFLKDPHLAQNELIRITDAVEAIPQLRPIERAGNRFKALTTLYRTEPLREAADLAETPIMTMIKSHNPAVLTNKTGVIVVSDALEARHRINELILGLAGHNLQAQPYLRAELTEQYRSAPITMKAELAGSQVRLVLLRTWLAELPQVEIDQLEARLATVIETATDLDLISLQLSFRSIIDTI